MLFHPISEVEEGNHTLKAAVALPMATEVAEFGRKQLHLEHHSLFGELGPSHQIRAGFCL